MRNTILTLGLVLLAGMGYAATGVQGERVADTRDQVAFSEGYAPAMVFAVRYEPGTGIVTDLVRLSRVKYHAGTLAPLVYRGIFRSLPIAHSSGGMPG